MNQKSTKKGKLFYEELVRPMIRLANRNKKMGITKMSSMNKAMVEDMFVMTLRVKCK